MPKAKKSPADATRLIGYARVSTREQNLQMQIDELRAGGVLEDDLWIEKVSGVSPESDNIYGRAAVALRRCLATDHPLYISGEQ